VEPLSIPDADVVWSALPGEGRRSMTDLIEFFNRAADSVLTGHLGAPGGIRERNEHVGDGHR